MSTEYGPQNPQPIQHEQILPWIEVSQSARLNADVLERLMPPLEGSFLRPTADDPLKNMAWWCHGFLEAAVDHLLLWADYAAPLKFHPEALVAHTLRPAFTLARAAIEAAAQAIWVLSPEDPKARGARYVVLATWDVNEQLKAAVATESRSELKGRRDEIFAKLGVTARSFRPPRYLDMIREAAEFLDLGDSNPAMSPDGIERVWRSAAAAAHGKQWPESEFHDRTDAGDGLVYSVPKTEEISQVLQVAERLMSAGVVLFAMRAGRMESFHALWDEAVARLASRITTVSGAPIEPVPQTLIGDYEDEA